MTLNVLKQGNSIDLKYGLKPSQDMTEWNCRVVLKQDKSIASALQDFNITTRTVDNQYFIGMITPAMTSNLPIGNYHIMAELSNNITNQSVEIHDKIKVEQQGVF